MADICLQRSNINRFTSLMINWVCWWSHRQSENKNKSTNEDKKWGWRVFYLVKHQSSHHCLARWEHCLHRISHDDINLLMTYFDLSLFFSLPFVFVVAAPTRETQRSREKTRDKERQSEKKKKEKNRFFSLSFLALLYKVNLASHFSIFTLRSWWTFFYEIWL